MWYAGETSIGYSGEGNSFELPLFIPRWEKCPREVFSIPCISEKYE